MTDDPVLHVRTCNQPILHYGDGPTSRHCTIQRARMRGVTYNSCSTLSIKEQIFYCRICNDNREDMQRFDSVYPSMMIGSVVMLYSCAISTTWRAVCKDLWTTTELPLFALNFIYSSDFSSLRFTARTTQRGSPDPPPNIAISLCSEIRFGSTPFRSS